MEATVVSLAVTEKGQHFAEIHVLLDNGQLTSLRGPGRRNKPEALKDCLELRKVAVKCTDDPKLSQVRAIKKQLEGTTWTVKDLGGRQLDGAEGPPPNFKMPSWAPTPAEGGPLGYVSPGKFRASVQPTAKKEDDSVYSFKTRKLVVEVAESDIQEAVGGGDSWASKAKVALQQAFKRFGPVLEVRAEMRSDDGERVASVRFAAAKAVEQAMSKALGGWLPVGDSHVRVRQPSADGGDAKSKFSAPRRSAPALEAAPNKKKLRPNERFASKPTAKVEEEAESKEPEPAKQAAPSVAPPPPVEPPPPPAPDRPTPSALAADASDEDKEVFKGEEEVVREMTALLEKPFSQQKKALKVIRARWHPDKNPDSVEVATRVFQFIQSHDTWLEHHGLA